MDLKKQLCKTIEHVVLYSQYPNLAPACESKAYVWNMAAYSTWLQPVAGIATLKCTGAILKVLKNIESANFKALALWTIFKALVYAKKKS
jgi:hypothetical protein